MEKIPTHSISIFKTFWWQINILVKLGTNILTKSVLKFNYKQNGTMWYKKTVAISLINFVRYTQKGEERWMKRN